MITKSIGDLADVTKLAGFEYSKYFEYRDDGEIIALRGLNVKDGNLDLTNVKRIEKSISEKLPRSKLVKDDILLTYTGTLGEVALIKENDRYHLAPNVCLIRPKEIDPYLLFSYMRTRNFKQSLDSLTVGSTQKTIPMKNIRQIKISYTEENIQNVTNFSRYIDKKIELNQKMNRTLEDIAETLFKSWFIDFDPVRAKAEGRPTGLSKEISDLFPDSFEDSQFGEIPKGWQIKEIQELCESISSGGTPKRKQKDYWENGTIDWFKTGELLDTYLLESEEKITDSAVKESSCKLWNKGTILFAIYASPTVGRLGILTKPSTSNQAAAGLIPKESVGIPFLKNLLLFSRKEMQHIASGAAQQNINVGILKEFKVISPNHEIAGHFSKINEPIEKKIFSNLREISYLSQIRDLLLPKLISGELKISDAENMVEEAGI